MYKHILLALEGKPSDKAAIEHAIALAQGNSAAITFLRVITVAADGASGLGKQLQIEPGSKGWKRKRQAHLQLAALKEQHKSHLITVDTSILIGDRSEADEIVIYAKERDVDLIVMAADGRSWWRRVFFGCPADGVQRKATVPTLFVSDGTRRAQVSSGPETPPSSMMSVFGSSGI